MSEKGTEPRALRRELLAPAVLAFALGAVIAGALLFRSAPQPKAPEPAPPVEPAPPPPAPSPLPPPPLSRADLVRHANGAAARVTGEGAGPAEDGRALVGRRFVLRLPFGCDGAQPRGGRGQTSALYDPEAQTVRLNARPSDWIGLPVVQTIGGAAPEAVEGFWITRPWSFSEACPPARAETAAPPSPTAPSPETLGLAQFFGVGDSRILRRGDRPYEHVRRLAGGDTGLLSHSYVLVLEGRLRAYPDGRPLRCWSESADHRPVCLYSVQFERVAFEDAADGATLAEWRES